MCIFCHSFLPHPKFKWSKKKFHQPHMDVFYLHRFFTINQWSMVASSNSLKTWNFGSCL
jgi:hypothetical protein